MENFNLTATPGNALEHVALPPVRGQDNDPAQPHRFWSRANDAVSAGVPDDR